MAKEKIKHGKKKLKIKKKLRKAMTRTTIAEVQENLGAELVMRRWPGGEKYHSWLSNVRAKRPGAKHYSSDLKICCGVGDTPAKALRNLAKKLKGLTLRPERGGPCKNGLGEMFILGKVLPL